MQSPTHEDVNRLKIKVAGKYHLEAVPSNADLISALTPLGSKKAPAHFEKKKYPHHQRRNSHRHHD